MVTDGPCAFGRRLHLFEVDDALIRPPPTEAAGRCRRAARERRLPHVRLARGDDEARAR